MSIVIKSKWEIKKLSDVAEVILGQSPPSSSYNTDGIGLPFFQGKAEFTELHPVVRKYSNSPTKVAQKDDILLSVRAPIGPTNVADTECGIGRGLAAIRCKHNYKYILYYFKLIENQLDALGTGTTFRAITGPRLRNLPVAFAPEPLQDKVVTRIEELFSEVDKSIGMMGVADDLLHNLHLSSLNNSTKGNENAGFVELKLDSLLVPGRDALKTGPFGTLIGKKDYTADGIPIIGIENIGELKFIDNGFKKYVSEEKYSQLKSYEVKAGDILISRSGTVGEICVVPEGINGIISTNLIRVRVNPHVILPEYFIALFKGSSIVLSQIKDLCKGSSRLFLNQGIMKQIKYPVPTLDMQEQLLDELNRLLSVEEALSRSVKQLRLQAQSLKRSILLQAFSGELV